MPRRMVCDDCVVSVDGPVPTAAQREGQRRWARWDLARQAVASVPVDLIVNESRPVTARLVNRPGSGDCSIP